MPQERRLRIIRIVRVLFVHNLLSCVVLCLSCLGYGVCVIFSVSCTECVSFFLGGGGNFSVSYMFLTSCMFLQPIYKPKNTPNPLTPNDHYSGRTAPLTSRRCILYIYSTNIDTEYFKIGINSPSFFSSKCSLFRNSNVFGSCFIHILYTGCAKI